MQKKSNIYWQDDVPVSNEFDDIYFSKENGLEESRYVFIEKNDIPQKITGLTNDFTIIETGFGTGLNFFATCELWEKSKTKLNFISIEKFPLSAEQIKKAISHWPELGEYMQKFVDNYHIPDDGILKLQLFDNIYVEILFMDVSEAMPKITKKADSWYLDGFAPSKNPDMWSDSLFNYMPQLSNKGASFSTFTAAGFVKRALIEAGFEVQKTRGFGHKRDMLIGTYKQ